ncbi:MAG: cobalamin biosynthesis protein [Planctomycetes bacterium]|nr:cobalamin biosynthesis protein [Planctomycetota bacterium]
MGESRKSFAIYVITKHGLVIAARLRQAIPDAALFVSTCLADQAPEDAISMSLPMGPTLESAWTEYNCHIHIISVGAVVRMIKDLLVDKKVDPAVICIDDAARFAICVLSGHGGRGNEFTERVARAVGATPVVTTASDSIGTLTVDILGRDLGWQLDELERNVTLACAEVVNGNRTCFIQETGEPDFWPLDQRLPSGVHYATDLDLVKPDDFAILMICSDRCFKESHPAHWNKSVIYRPKSLVLGLGCDRDTPIEVVENGVLRFLDEQGLSLKSVRNITSIDKKADEAALLELSQKYDWRLDVYPAEQLDVVEGIKNPSESVKKYVGTRSVAEAACLLSAGTNRLLMEKHAHRETEGGRNMTCAIARIPFETRPEAA